MSAIEGAPDRVVTIDVRSVPEGDLIARITELAAGLVERFAALTPEPGPAALVVRHDPAPSGRLSGSRTGEVAVCAARAFIRQLRYDRSWTKRELVFLDGRDATDAELAPLLAAALAGTARVELERTSAATAAYGWERGHGL